MPTLAFNAAVRDLALEIAWSLWAELGLSGWTRHHADSAVDLEPLIIATPRLGDWDARLLEESFDWCVQNSRFVSAVRLRNMLTTWASPLVAPLATLLPRFERRGGLAGRPTESHFSFVSPADRQFPTCFGQLFSSCAFARFSECPPEPKSCGGCFLSHPGSSS